MPRYVYKCCTCDFVFDVFHSMSEEYDKHICEQCECEREVKKLPASFYSFDKSDKGKVVKEFISDAKESLREQRREARENKHVDTNTDNNSGS